MSEPTHVWMQHETTGGRALFPVASVALWEPRGWRVIDDGTPVPVAGTPAASYPTPIHEAAADAFAASSAAADPVEPPAEPEPTPAKGTKSKSSTENQE